MRSSASPRGTNASSIVAIVAISSATADFARVVTKFFPIITPRATKSGNVPNCRVNWAAFDVVYDQAWVQRFGRHGVYLVCGPFPVVRQIFRKPRDQE
jgi:hypothetical protein